MAVQAWHARTGLRHATLSGQRFDAADKSEQALFADLLTAQDPELQAWILNGVAHPDPAFQRLIDRIRGT